MNTFKIRPKAGPVYDPTTGAALSQTGEMKPRSNYWLRRLHFGEIEIVESTPQPQPTAETPVE
jgi:hypothetical protein